MSNYNDNSWSDKFSWIITVIAMALVAILSIGLLCALFVQPQEDEPEAEPKDGAVISDLGEGASTVYYRLAVSYGNGQSGIDVKLPAGTEYKLPATPSKVGYIFMGWKCSSSRSMARATRAMVSTASTG